MNSRISILVLEASDLPTGYELLHIVKERGHEPLQFWPHADGVRLFFRLVQAVESDEILGWIDGVSLAKKSRISTWAPPQFHICVCSERIIQALLSQTSQQLAERVLIVETQSLVELLNLASSLEAVGMAAVEIRSLRSNVKRNCGIFTGSSLNEARGLLANHVAVEIPSSSAALREFLGFTGPS
jgi:hypothetical protein